MSSNVVPFTPRPASADMSDRASAPVSGPVSAPTRPGTVLRMDSCAVYSVREVARLLSLSLGSTYTLVRSGEIPALKLGGRWVIPRKRFHTWLDNLPDASVEDFDREMKRLERKERH